MTRLLDPFLTLIYPAECGVCGDSVESSAFGAACENCWTETRIFHGTETLCFKCGAYLRSGVGESSTCGSCDDHEYDSALAVGIYERALAATVLRLKHSSHLPDHMARLCRERTVALPSKPDIVVPLPLSKKRQLERGFNQADVIAEIVSRSTGATIERSALRRKLHADRNRAMMDRKGRELSVRKAFEVTDPSIVREKSVLIVDDVFTSGATASSCARALKKKGAASVIVFTLARAL